MYEMGDPAKRRAAYERLVAVPLHQVAEIINGELIVNPRPAAPHARAASVLGVQLGGPFDLGQGGPGGWIILDEPELHLDDDVLVPDLAGWRRSRMPATPAVAAFELAPDWICEVLSPSTRAVDVDDKLPIYAREKIGHVWFIDPLARVLEILRLDGDTFRVTATGRDGAKLYAEPFDAIELALGPLWT